MRFQAILRYCIAGGIGAVAGGAILTIACRVQNAGWWHPGYPIAGACLGTLLEVGIACKQSKQASVMSAATIAGAIVPAMIGRLPLDDGSYVVFPAIGTFTGIALVALGQRIFARCGREGK